jgi:hypothetical protein
MDNVEIFKGVLADDIFQLEELNDLTIEEYIEWLKTLSIEDIAEVRATVA